MEKPELGVGDNLHESLVKRENIDSTGVCSTSGVLKIIILYR